MRAEDVEAEGNEVVVEGVVNGNGEVEEGEGGKVEEGVEGEGKVVLEWKPRVKLGDIMGVMFEKFLIDYWLFVCWVSLVSRDRSIAE